MSAVLILELRLDVRNAGFDEHIIKLVDGDAVLTVVRRFLQGRAGGRR